MIRFAEVGRVVVAVTLACLAMGCQQSRPPPDTLLVLTFNIFGGGDGLRRLGMSSKQFGPSRIDELAEIVRLSGAGVVGLQEEGTIDLRKELGPGWTRYGSVYSRWPLEAITLSNHLSVLRLRFASGRCVVLVNVHWWQRGYPPFRIRDLLREGALPEDPEDLERMILEGVHYAPGRGPDRTLEVLEPYLASGDPVVLMGDFNEPSHLDWTRRAAREGLDRWVGNPTPKPLRFELAWRGSTELQAAGLRDAYRTVFPDEVAKPGITWTPPHKMKRYQPYAEEVLDRIDFIYFGGQGIEVEDAAVVGEDPAWAEIVYEGPWPSDHRAVLARFALTGPSCPTPR
jgi:hypothetical protein